MYDIEADDLFVGEGAVIEDGVIIRGRSSRRARRVHIGDYAFVGAGSRIVVDEFYLGAYSLLHNHALVAGDLPCHIGEGCWIGQNTILNSTGGLTVGRGVGIGAYSQLWTHIKHGDVLQGCRWHSSRPMTIGDDVWFVGHCIVSPIDAGPRSMALVGSVVTREMLADHTYAGTPAVDVTAKVGPQFLPVSLDEKVQRAAALRTEFLAMHPTIDPRLIAIAELDGTPAGDATVFSVATRSYVPRRSSAEFAFMQFLMTRTVKFFSAP